MKVLCWRGGVAAAHTTCVDSPDGDGGTGQLLVIDSLQYDKEERSFISRGVLYKRRLAPGESLVYLDTAEMRGRRWPVVCLASASEDHGLSLTVLALRQEGAMLVAKTPYVRVSPSPLATGSVSVQHGPRVVLHDSLAIHTYRLDGGPRRASACRWERHDVIASEGILRAAFTSCQQCEVICCVAVGRSASVYSKVWPESVSGDAEQAPVCPNPNCPISRSSLQRGTVPIPSEYCPIVTCVEILAARDLRSAEESSETVGVIFGTSYGQVLLAVGGAVEKIWPVGGCVQDIRLLRSDDQVLIGAVCDTGACHLLHLTEQRILDTHQPCVAVAVGNSTGFFGPSKLVLFESVSRKEGGAFSLHGVMVDVDGREAVRFGGGGTAANEEDLNHGEEIAGCTDSYSSAVRSLQEQWQASVRHTGRLRHQHELKKAHLQAACQLAQRLSCVITPATNTGDGGQSTRSRAAAGGDDASLVTLLAGAGAVADGDSADGTHADTGVVEERPLTVRLIPDRANTAAAAMCTSCSERTILFEVSNRSPLPVRDLAFHWVPTVGRGDSPYLPSVKTETDRGLSGSAAAGKQPAGRVAAEHAECTGEQGRTTGMPPVGGCSAADTAPANPSPHSGISCILPRTSCRVTVSLSAGLGDPLAASSDRQSGTDSPLCLDRAFLQCACLRDGRWHRRIYSLDTLLVK